jgi:hypothetical protein
MQILDQNNDLKTFLMSLSNKHIKIITAFASGTEDIISSLLNNKNKVEIIIGTINSFSSPKLIKFCKSQDAKNIKTYVDFRYHNSIHWKLYLIEPETIIIGSANFTTTGISLSRDTCIVIRDKSTYDSYQKEMVRLTKNPKVINSNKELFSQYLDQYINNHSAMQRSLARTKQYNNPLDWLNDDSNQKIPILIWSRFHSEEEKETAQKILEESEPELTRNNIKDFFTSDRDKDDFSYEEGDVVITARNNGNHIKFQFFDRIIYKDGKHYIYELEKKRKHPFELKNIKEKLKLKIPNWYDEDVAEIDRDDIRESLIANN